MGLGVKALSMLWVERWGERVHYVRAGKPFGV